MTAQRKTIKAVRVKPLSLVPRSKRLGWCLLCSMLLAAELYGAYQSIINH